MAVARATGSLRRAVYLQAYKLGGGANRDLGAARPGQRVEIVADTYPDRTFPGTIASVAAEAEFTPRNIQTRDDRDRLVYAVRVTIENPDEKLRPGMPVEVRIVHGGEKR